MEPAYSTFRLCELLLRHNAITCKLHDVYAGKISTKKQLGYTEKKATYDVRSLLI